MDNWVAIVDFLPIMLFLGASYFLREKFFSKMTKNQYASFWIGCILIVIAGFLKAIYKLFYFFQIFRIVLLSDVFMVLEALGFTMMAIGLVSYMVFDRDPSYKSKFEPKKVFSYVLVVVIFVILGAIFAFFAEYFADEAGDQIVLDYSITMILVGIMVIGLIASYLCLIIESLRNNCKLTAVLFVITIIFALGMGYLSTRDFDSIYMNFIAELENTVGQLLFLIASYRLYKCK